MPVRRTEHERHRRQHVFEHRHVLAHVALVFHAELRQRAATDDQHALVQPRTNRRGRKHQGVDRRAAKRLDVGPGGRRAPDRLCHSFREVPTAALVAVADGLFAGIEDVLDRGRIRLRERQRQACRLDRRGFAGEVLQDQLGRLAQVLEVPGFDPADGAPRVGERRGAVRRLAIVEMHELERIRLGKSRIERILVEDVSEGALFARGLHGLTESRPLDAAPALQARDCR